MLFPTVLVCMLLALECALEWRNEADLHNKRTRNESRATQMWRNINKSRVNAKDAQTAKKLPGPPLTIENSKQTLLTDSNYRSTELVDFISVNLLSRFHQQT